MVKHFFIIFCIFVMFSCSMPTNEPLSKYGDIVLDATWGAYYINSENMLFRTQVGIKTINHKVQIVGRDYEWYLWGPGYGMPIERIY